MKRFFSTAMKAASSSQAGRGRWAVEKISARVFCPHQDDGSGGHAITVFACDHDEDDQEEAEEHGSPSIMLSAKTRQRLAQSSNGPSVMVYPNRAASDNDRSSSSDSLLSFYLPSGQETTVSAHAAMAGAIRVAEETDQATPLECTVPPRSSSQPATDPTIFNPFKKAPKAEEENKESSADSSLSPLPVTAVVHEDDIVSLQFEKATFRQEKMMEEEEASMYRFMRDFCSFQLTTIPRQINVSADRGTGGLPTMMRTTLELPSTTTPHSLVTNNNDDDDQPPLQPKDGSSSSRTEGLVLNFGLVYVMNIETLMETCQAPAINTSKRWSFFQRACRNLKIDQGVIVYTNHPEQDGTWICRHFAPPTGPFPTTTTNTTDSDSDSTPPPTSEVASSGIGMAALAAAIQMGQQTEIDLPFYKFQQGQAMGHPSLVMVENIQVLRDYVAERLEKEAEEEFARHQAMSVKEKEEKEKEEASKNLKTNHNKNEEEEEEEEDDDEAAEAERNRLAREAELDDPQYYEIHAKINFTIMGKIEIDETQEMEIENEDTDKEVAR